MSRSFVISDTHFGHGNIITHANRPFDNNEHMVNEMVAAWNDTVGRDDVVYHLGDLGWQNTEYNLDVLSRLHYGKLVLVCGNHDSQSALRAYHTMGIQIQDYLEVATPQHKIRTCLFHYPMQEWNGYFRHSIHLHGHTHSAIYSDMPGRYNVAVEAIGYKPKPLIDVEQEHIDLINHLKPKETPDENHH